MRKEKGGRRKEEERQRKHCSVRQEMKEQSKARSERSPSPLESPPPHTLLVQNVEPQWSHGRTRRGWCRAPRLSKALQNAGSARMAEVTGQWDWLLSIKSASC